MTNIENISKQDYTKATNLLEQLLSNIQERMSLAKKVSAFSQGQLDNYQISIVELQGLFVENKKLEFSIVTELENLGIEFLDHSISFHELPFIDRKDYQNLYDKYNDDNTIWMNDQEKGIPKNNHILITKKANFETLKEKLIEIGHNQEDMVFSERSGVNPIFNIKGSRNPQEDIPLIIKQLQAE